MNYETLNELLTKARVILDNNNFQEAETLANELLEKLEKLRDSTGNTIERQIDEIQCEAIIILSQSKSRRSDNAAALKHALASIELAEAKNLSGEVKAKTFGNIGTVYYYLSDNAQALNYYQKALAINEEIGNKFGMAANLSNIGTMYHTLSDYPQALTYFQKALAFNEEIGNKNGIAINLGNIGVMYKNLSEYPQALTYFQKALVIHEEIGSKYGIAINLGNMGTVYENLSDYPQALAYSHKALVIYEEIGKKDGIALMIGNLGIVYMNLSDYAQALSYYQKALALAEEIGYKYGIANNLGCIGQLHAMKQFDGYDTDKAEEYFQRAIALFDDIGAKMDLYSVHKSLAELYETQERWKEHSIQFKKYHEIEKEVQSEEAHKQAGLMEQRRQAAEREKEIEIAKAAAAATLNATTTLLHRVLPESISTRMIQGEENISDFFPSVSILFADIQGFTAISANMKAHDVVRFLNYVFGEFDRIMKKHGCEKIKTIGDGYMAVAGAPIECEDHAERLAAAALEMQENIHLPEDIRASMPSGARFGIRIGLHTGPVVAGVIGEERFVYDIHSDAVNLASRMESSGEVDRVHVSANFVNHLQDRFKKTKNTKQGIRFEDRGEIEIKGKGKMKTYFLE